jgi:uncharacterized protein (TIGR03066 family)
MKLSPIFILIALLALIGCSKPDPMVGTWQLQMDPAINSQLPSSQKISATVEFRADKTFTVDLNLGSRKEQLEGTYTLEGKTLTMTPTKENGKPSSDKPEVVTLSDDMKSFEMPGGMGKIVKQ